MATIDELVGTLYEIVQDAWAVPLGGDKCVIERDKVLDILDELRENMPADLKIARDIVAKREEFLATGKREVEGLKKQAEDYAKKLVSEQEIMSEAKKKANEMLAETQTKCKQLRAASGEFCESRLKDAEEIMAKALDEMKKSHQHFKNISK